MTPLTRRRFLGQGIRFAVVAVLGGSACRPASAVPLGGPVGIQLYAVKDALQKDPGATLRSIREIGFREVETAGFAGLAVQQFRRLLDAAGLKCPSAHLQFDGGNLGESFDQAHALGAQFAASGSLRAMVSPDGRPPPLGMSLDEAKRTAELANHLGEEARRAGLQYAYHNHDFEFAAQDGGAIGYDLLLKETDPALVKFEIDCGWMVVGGRDPRTYFQRYPGRFPMIHVKDFLPSTVAERPGGPPSHPGAELGHGMIDYGPIFAAAKKAGLQHYFAEQEGPFTRMTQLDAARQAYRYLSTLT